MTIDAQASWSAMRPLGERLGMSETACRCCLGQALRRLHLRIRSAPRRAQRAHHLRLRGQRRCGRGLRRLPGMQFDERAGRRDPRQRRGRGDPAALAHPEIRICHRPHRRRALARRPGRALGGAKRGFGGPDGGGQFRRRRGARRRCGIFARLSSIPPATRSTSRRQSYSGQVRSSEMCANETIDLIAMTNQAE